MKKVGFRRKIDWGDPFMVLFVVFTAIGIFAAILLTVLSAWKEGWVVSASFGGIGILFGMLGFIIQFLDS